MKVRAIGGAEVLYDNRVEVVWLLGQNQERSSGVVDVTGVCGVSKRPNPGM